MAGPVPASLRAVVRKGLAVDPQDRFESMDALLEAMVRVRSRSGARRRLQVVAGLLVLGGAGFVAAEAMGDDSTPCAQAGRPPDEAWNAPVRRQLEQHLAQFLSRDTIVRTVAGLERHADAWSAAHLDACEDTWVRGEQSSTRLDARMDCLRRQWTEVGETVALLAEADTVTAGRSAELVLGLPPARACAQVSADAGVHQAGPAEVDATERALARVHALRRAARYDEAWAELAAWPEALPGEAATAQVAARTLARGQLLEDRGELVQAEQVHRQALHLAKAAGDARAEAEAWLSLARVTSELYHDDPRARFLAQMGMAAVESAGGDDRIDAWAQTLLGSLAFVEGDDLGAHAHWERALELRLRLYGEHHPLTASSINNLGGVLYGQGQLDDAAEQLRRALDIREQLFGPDHPDVAGSAANLGLVMSALGREDDALGWHQRALDIMKASLGPEHPALIRIHDGLAQALHAAGRSAQAREHWERVRQLAATHLPPHHPLLGAPLLGLAEIALAEGEPSTAETLVREALLVVADDSMDALARAQAWLTLGRVLDARGASREAREAMTIARAHTDEAGDEGRELRAEIDAWLGVGPTPEG